MEPVKLYHEQQLSSLCGLHCLNSLLQGPYFTEIDLSHYAQQLDQLEKQVAGTQLLPTELNEESANVRADGMFSVQVLQMALEVWGLSLTPLTNPQMQQVAQEPSEQQAFVCNLLEHWFTLRKIDTQWWNFDSVKRAPEPLSSFYLSAFLSTLQEQGYTVFFVGGDLPRRGGLNQQSQSSLDGNGRWFTPDEAIKESKLGQQIRENSRISSQNGYYNTRNFGDSEDVVVIDDEDEQLEAAIMASLVSQRNAVSGRIDGQNDTSVIVDDQIEDSQIEELDGVDFEQVDKNTVFELGFRLLDGSKINQKFLKTHKSGILKDFINKRLKIDLDLYDIVSQFPRRVLNIEDSDKTLCEIGMEDREVFLFAKKEC